VPGGVDPARAILELRTRVRLPKTLIDQRTAWLQRLRAQLFHQGVPPGLKPIVRFAAVSISPLTFCTTQRPGVLRSTETVFAPKFATARSGLPSPFKSAIATDRGARPVR
jgi:hypothetical protein